MPGCLINCSGCNTNGKNSWGRNEKKVDGGGCVCVCVEGGPDGGSENGLTETTSFAGIVGVKDAFVLRLELTRIVF